MPTSNFLNAPFGGATAAKFEQGGISQLFLMPHAKLTDTTDILDAFGAVKSVTAMSVVTDGKFVEIDFVEGSASYTDVYKPSATKRFMELALSFTVDDSGADAVEKAHQLLLTRRHVALIKRKNGKWYLLGQSDGLTASDANANSGAKREDDSAMTFTLVGGNNGFAAEVVMETVALDALLLRLA